MFSKKFLKSANSLVGDYLVLSVTQVLVKAKYLKSGLE